jgi:hypothetical protein
MKKAETHPDRASMIKAAQTGKVPFAPHLARCAECRELYELFVQYCPDERLKDLAPSPQSVAKAKAVPKLVASRNPARAIAGRVAFDSWADVPAVQLRSTVGTLERRIRLEAGKYTLELVADRVQTEWEFVARIYDRQKVTSEFILQVGRRKLVPQSQRCYYWSAKNPPRTMQLLSQELKIEFGKLTW